jgi:hypothetical protein
MRSLVPSCHRSEPLVVGFQPRPPLLIEFVRGTRISREPEVVSRLLLLLLSL